MNARRSVSLLILTLLLAGCAGMPGQESEARNEPEVLREELRQAEDEKQRLKQQLADLQRQLRDEQQKLQGQLAERQRQLREEQRKVEELEGKVVALEKKVETLRRIDRETLQRSIRR